MRIGPYTLSSRVILAPMAGVTDRPFRQLARHFGAGLAVAEMVASDAALWHTRKSRLRRVDESEPSPRAIQIAGADPQMMAEAARRQVAHGAQIIDINMGCPAKKVCRRAAGSALLRDEILVSDILRAVVGAVPVPVTLKIRTGWDTAHRNATRIARIAEEAGIQALAVHGRTRACRFIGPVEYDTIAEVVAAVDIPVIANGDIDSPQTAAAVLQHTGAAAVMVGRAAQGRPWLLGQIADYIDKGQVTPAPSRARQARIVLDHLTALHTFYGEGQGVRIARKHIGWYLADHARPQWRKKFNQLESAGQQYTALHSFFKSLIDEDQAA